MQRNAVVGKRKMLWDGVEVPGLVSIDEIVFENKTVDVTDFSEEHTVDAAIMKVPPVVIKYRLDAGTTTSDFFEKFHLENQVKDGVLIKTDAYGNEIKRYLFQSCSCFKRNIPKYDTTAPEYDSVTVTVNPWKIIPVAAR